MIGGRPEQDLWRRRAARTWTSGLGHGGRWPCANSRLRTLRSRKRPAALAMTGTPRQDARCEWSGTGRGDAGTAARLRRLDDATTGSTGTVTIIRDNT